MSPKSLNCRCDDIGRGVSGRRLGHEGGALLNGICVLSKEPSGSSLTSSAMRRHSEKTAILNQEVGPCQILNLPVPWPWAYQNPELGEIDVCCLCHADWTKTFWFYLCLDKILKLLYFIYLFILLVLSPCVSVTEHRASDTHWILVDVCGLLISPIGHPGLAVSSGPALGQVLGQFQGQFLDVRSGSPLPLCLNWNCF